VRGEYKYNAFISYRQVDRDRKVANRLHQELEKYKIPKALVKQGFPSKLSKVFKDVDELSANPNLSEAIYEALRESEYLIVICSPRTQESKWISQEIDIFIKLGRTDKVLTLIIEGEIEESIPSLLRGGTLPLAADIRNSHHLPSLKKISIAKLRLIAPIIGCDYDDLFQRDEKRKREFIMTVTVIFSVVMLVLAIIFGKLSYQLDNSNQSLQKSNTELNLTNQKLNQAIFETSAIYAQFFLTAQDDYTKWSKITTKIMDTLNHKDVDKAIKINEILAKYISIKGYELEKDTNILPFHETPQYFLKTLFFRNAKYTTGYIEDRYLSLLLLDDIEFPAKLFLFCPIHLSNYLKSTKE